MLATQKSALGGAAAKRPALSRHEVRPTTTNKAAARPISKFSQVLHLTISDLQSEPLSRSGQAPQKQATMSPFDRSSNLLTLKF